MKIVLQACISSVIIHLVYISCTLGFGYIKTKYYKPTIQSEWESLDFLQNEVAVGIHISPFIYALSLVGVSIICGLILLLYKRLFS